MLRELTAKNEAVCGMQVDAHMLGLAVGELPGVGWSSRSRLTDLGIESVADVRKYAHVPLSEPAAANSLMRPLCHNSPSTSYTICLTDARNLSCGQTYLFLYMHRPGVRSNSACTPVGSSAL